MDDGLREKMQALAMQIADTLLYAESLADKIDGLKTLTTYYTSINKSDPKTPPSGKWADLSRRVYGEGEDAEAA